MKSFLAGYKVNDFVMFFQREVLFPCHKLLEQEDLTIKQVNEKVRDGSLLLCRGYVESMKRSAKLPKDAHFAKIVKEVELSENSMSIFEFTKHHTYEKDIYE